MIQLTFFSDFLVVFPGCAPAEPDPELSTGIAADGAPSLSSGLIPPGQPLECTVCVQYVFAS